MRNKGFILAVIAVIVLAGCAQGDTQVIDSSEKANVWVVNSAWQVVGEYTLVSRAIESLDAVQAQVDTYNATTTDDQLTIIADEDDLPIELAPEATLTIVFADNYEVDATTTIPRENLAEEREIYRDRANYLKYNEGSRGAILYVDNAPPEYNAPPPPDTRTDYEKYSIYVVALDGSILFEEHCTETPREDEDICTDEEYFIARLRTITASIYSEWPEGSRVVSGQIYTPPEPEVEE